MTVKTISVCTDDSCTGDGAKKLLSRLASLVNEMGLADEVRIESSGCLKKCGKGPVAHVDPGGIRVKRVKPKKAGVLLEQVLAGKVKKSMKKQKGAVKSAG